jgi:hypothetical protein
MNNPSEDSIVRAILKYINKLPRCVAEKTVGNAFKSGQPDITAAVAGRRVELEVKRPGKDATPLQQRRLSKWASGGAVVGCVHSVAEVRDLFEAHGMIR